MINESNIQFDAKAKKLGEVNFTKSSLSDPYIQRALQLASNVLGADAVQARVSEAMDNMERMYQTVPFLMETMYQQAAESAAFDVVQEATKRGSLDPSFPQFREMLFFRLVRYIQAEHSDFFPLRSFIDRRVLMNPTFVFEDAIPTAAAYPSGKFAFNKRFMQSLMNFAHIKGVKPQGSKYTSNGGNIPDEYCYIEFVIMHEFMHYSHDDFYYGKIIPNANQRIINWVGDFRTNYLLVKSGFEQLPIGLFSDNINYDRQKSYVEMYDIVKEHYDKLYPETQDDLSEMMDNMSDDHKPGEKQANSDTQTDTSKIKPSDITKNDKKVQDSSTGTNNANPNAQAGNNTGTDSAQLNNNAQTHAIDINIRPTFNWKQLIAKFVSSAKPKQEETYTKISRRGVSSTHMIAQRGAAAIKPGVMNAQLQDSKLLFCFDTSGSMMGAIGKCVAEAKNLMSYAPNATVSLAMFSDSFQLFRAMLRQNKAGAITSYDQKNVQYNMSLNQVLTNVPSGGTDFSSALVANLTTAMSQGYNVIILSDADLSAGSNLANLEQLISINRRQVFVIFNTKRDYEAYRANAKTPSTNVTYMT